MAGEWRATTLGEVIELKRGYDLPQQRRTPGRVPLVSSSGVTDYHEAAMVKGPGVATGRYGTLGQVFFIAEDFWPLNTTLYVRDFKGNDPRFVSYFLREIDFQAYSDKAAVPGLNRNHLHQARVRLPSDINEQRAIAHILGTLDDKIELNRRMNATLEEMARALFKSWFVDFDPVRAKVEGRDTGLPRELADLFPDEFEESEMGEVPKGWRVSTISAIALILKDSVMPGKSPTKVWEHYSIPAFDAARAPALETGDTIKSGKYRVPFTCVLVSKLNPQFPRVWYPNVQDEESAICSTEFIPFVPRDSKCRSYLYELMKSDSIQRAIEEHVTGSTGSRQRAKPDDIASTPIVVPPQELLRQFSRLVSSMHARIDEAINESRTLAALRDTLLPKLISGEVRVPDAEESVI